LHPEHAAVEVHYRMHNTGPKVEQDFFFPVERWGSQDGEIPREPVDLDHYQIGADGQELPWSNVAAPTSEKAAVFRWSLGRERSRHHDAQRGATPGRPKPGRGRGPGDRRRQVRSETRDALQLLRVSESMSREGEAHAASGGEQRPSA